MQFTLCTLLACGEGRAAALQGVLLLFGDVASAPASLES